jgi:L-ascorbate metabolism protein UlaG (beta-lactamase superfamily)
MTRLLPIITAAALAALFARAPARQPAGVAVTYIANEGVLLSAGGKKVLIDGLFTEYGPEYAIPADSTQAALETARAPFDAVDLVLVTHRHGDHFHPAPMAAHLLANPRATLVTSQQVIDSLRAIPAGRTLPASRWLARTTAPGTRRREVVNGVAIELLGLPHGGARHRHVEHLGYIVELGGRRVLHVGDTDVSDAAFAPFRLDTARIDVALLPAWMMTSESGRRVIEQRIRPRQIVAIHMGRAGAAGTERTAREVATLAPRAIALVRSLEAHRW